jgi:hypothetical protein
VKTGNKTIGDQTTVIQEEERTACLHNKGSEIAYNENDQQDEQETAQENKHG